MSIQIIDNFELGTAKPLDNRFVVGPSSFYQSKDMIPHKYVGLRVWDLNFGLPFVWIGGTWSNENVGSAVVTGGVGGYIPKFLGSGTSNTLSSSIIYEFQSGGTVNIGINTPSPAAKLDVNGSFKASSIETANGFAISNLDASKITNGTLTLNRLQNGTTGQILVAGAIATWQSNTTIRVGSALGLAISSDISTNSTFDLLFSTISEIYPDSLSPSSYYVKSAQSGTKRIQFNPSSGQLLIGGGASSDGTAVLPVYSFSSDTNTGIYRPGNDALSISLGGVETIKFSNTESVLSLNRISGNINFDMNARVGNSYLNTTYTITLRQEVGSGVNNFIIRSSYKTFNFDDGELSFPPTQRLKLTSSELIIGTDNVGSAFIRMSGVASAVGTLGTLRPTYSFWGADTFGMGRDGSSVYISASGNRIVDVKSSVIKLGNITGFEQSFLNVQEGIGIEGNWFSLNATYTSNNFQSAKLLTAGLNNPGPSGFFIKVQDNTGSGAYGVNFNTTFGLTPGNWVPQFSLKTNTSLYNNTSTGFFKTVYINNTGYLESGPVHTAVRVSDITINVNDTALVWILVSTNTTQINLPAAGVSAGKRFIIVNQLGTAKNISSYQSLGGNSETTIPAYTVLDLICDGSTWFRINN